MHIFVGNLAYAAKNEDIKKLFETFGEVATVSLKKKSGGNPRGFGFLEMPNDAKAQAAIAELNGKDFMGRPLIVTPKRPAVEKPKKDYKEIKRKRQEAKAAAMSAPVVVDVSVAKPEIKPKPRKDLPRRDHARRPKVSENRRGDGQAAPWKKKPGEVKKKFKTSR